MAPMAPITVRTSPRLHVLGKWHAAAYPVLLTFAAGCSGSTPDETTSSRHEALTSTYHTVLEFPAGMSHWNTAIASSDGDVKINDRARVTGAITSVAIVYWFNQDGIVPSLIAVAASAAAMSWWYSRKIEAPRVSMTPRQIRQEAGSMLKEFKEFAMRGNVIDMAVGIIIGGAFGTIVKSLVDDVIMPPIGVLLGGVDFSQIGWTLKPAMGDKPAVVIGIGKFIQAIVDFLIIAFAIFLVVKVANRMKREQPAPAPAGPTPTERLLAEIRDLLRQGR